MLQESITSPFIFFSLIIGLLLSSGYLTIIQFTKYRQERLPQQLAFFFFFALSGGSAMISAFFVFYQLESGSFQIFGLILQLMPIIPISLLFISTISLMQIRQRYLIIPIIALLTESIIWFIITFELIMLPANVLLSLSRLPQLIFVLILLIWNIITFFTLYRTSREYTALGFLISSFIYVIAGFIALAPGDAILLFLFLFIIGNAVIISSVYLARNQILAT